MGIGDIVFMFMLCLGVKVIIDTIDEILKSNKRRKDE